MWESKTKFILRSCGGVADDELDALRLGMVRSGRLTVCTGRPVSFVGGVF